MLFLPRHLDVQNYVLPFDSTFRTLSEKSPSESLKDRSKITLRVVSESSLETAAVAIAVFLSLTLFVVFSLWKNQL